jgi:hypothetical protein
MIMSGDTSVIGEMGATLNPIMELRIFYSILVPSSC